MLDRSPEYLRGTQRVLGRVLAAAALASLLAGPRLAAAATRRSLNLFEWMAVAPIVVAGEVTSADRKFVDVHVTAVIRGEIEEGSTVLVDQRLANRERREGASALDLELQAEYLLLLRPSSESPGRGGPVLALVRDVDGARPLPAEGREAWIDAARHLGRLQGIKDDGLLWKELGELLGSSNPLLASTALDLHLKFGRGESDALPEVRKLMSDARPDFRRRSVELAGTILGRSGSRTDPAAGGVLQEILARSRRDEAPQVRAAAVRALRALAGVEIDAALAQIAKDDPDQDVRYEAERALFERSGPEPAGETRERGD